MMKYFFGIPLLFVPAVAAAQMTTLVNFGDDFSANDLPGFLNEIFYVALGIAAMLAVLKIIIAGVKYMLSDVVTNKEEAKKDIKSALLGLVILLATVLILEVINPQLTNLNIFNAIERLPATQGSTPPNTNQRQQAANQAVQNAIASSTGACAERTDVTNGNERIVTENYSSCTGALIQFQNAFGRFCDRNNGSIQGNSVSQTVLVCIIPVSAAPAASTGTSIQGRSSQTDKVAMTDVPATNKACTDDWGVLQNLGNLDQDNPPQFHIRCDRPAVFGYAANNQANRDDCAARDGTYSRVNPKDLNFARFCIIN